MLNVALLLNAISTLLNKLRTLLLSLRSLLGERDNPTSQTTIAIVPPTEVQGMRKVKNFTVSFAGVGGQGDSPDRSFYYALVYVPQGYQPGVLYTPATGGARSMYTANQFVLSVVSLIFLLVHRESLQSYQGISIVEIIYT